MPSKTVIAAILRPFKLPSVEEWQNVSASLLPGAHVAAIASEIPYHRLVVSMEDAGFEIRDQIVWIGLDIVPIVLARKPVEGTICENVLKYGCGGLNVDGCRIGTQKITYVAAGASSGRERPSHLIDVGNDRTPDGRKLSSILKRQAERKVMAKPTSVTGRWPANLIFSKSAGKMLDEQSGKSKSVAGSDSGGVIRNGNSLII